MGLWLIFETTVVFWDEYSDNAARTCFALSRTSLRLPNRLAKSVAICSNAWIVASELVTRDVVLGIDCFNDVGNIPSHRDQVFIHRLGQRTMFEGKGEQPRHTALADRGGTTTHACARFGLLVQAVFFGSVHQALLKHVQGAHVEAGVREGGDPLISVGSFVERDPFIEGGFVNLRPEQRS